MSLVAIDSTGIKNAIVGDAQYLRSVIDWATTRYNIYNQNLTTDAMTAASIATADQNFILAFIGDLHRLITLASGTVPSDADNMTFNINALLGSQ